MELNLENNDKIIKKKKILNKKTRRIWNDLIRMAISPGAVFHETVFKKKQYLLHTSLHTHKT